MAFISKSRRKKSRNGRQNRHQKRHGYSRRLHSEKLEDRIPLSANQGVDFTTITSNGTNGSWSLGYQFKAEQATTVAQLGFYDDFQNGLTQSHAVGLYRSDGVLLASTTVTNADALVGFFGTMQLPR